MRIGVLATLLCAALVFADEALGAGTPTWFDAPPLPNASDFFVPRVAESPNGDSVFAWVTGDGPGSHAIAIATLPAGPGAPTISTDSRGANLNDASEYPPAIALSATGDAVVAWKEGPHSLGLRLRHAPGQFGSSVVTATPGANGHDTIESPVAAGADAHGNFTLAYGEELPVPYSGSGNIDRILVWDVDASNGLVTGPVFLGSTDTPSATAPIADVAVSVASDGSAVLAYHQNVSGVNDLLVSTRPGPTGTWSSPVVVDSSGDEPRVAAGPGGRALVAWQHLPDAPGATQEVRAALTPSTGTGFTPVGSSATGTLSDPSVTSSQPAIGLDAYGRGLVVWHACTTCLVTDTHDQLKAQDISASGQLDGPVQTVVDQGGVFGLANPQLAVTPSGGAVVVWADQTVHYQVLDGARRAAAGTPFQEDGPGGRVTSVVDGGPELAVDNAGDATVGWDAVIGKDVSLPGLARLDASPPVPGPITLTGPAAPLVALRFSLAPTDRVSATTVRWSFGDGGTASGTTARHLYTRGGVKTVTATVTDAAGYTATATRTLTLPRVTAPRFTGRVHMTPSKLHHSRKPPRIQLSWTLTASATLRLTVTRSHPGHRSRGRCSTRIRRGRRCTVPITVFSRTISAEAGTTKMRVILPHLKPGRYGIAVQAANSAGRSRTVRLTLIITR